MRNLQSRDELEKLKKEEKYLLLDFTAKWCGPCQALTPVLEYLEEDKAYSKLVIVKIDTDKFNKMSDDYGVKLLPTLCFMRDGKIVERIVGIPKFELLRSAVREYLGLKNGNIIARALHFGTWRVWG